MAGLVEPVSLIRDCPFGRRCAMRTVEPFLFQQPAAIESGRVPDSIGLKTHG